MNEIILASGSFLKNYIMKNSRLSYREVPADIDESVFDDFSVDQRVVKLAEAKCHKVSTELPDSVVIAADTLTANQLGQVFTKPAPDQDPLDAAMKLSGQTINVYTGCCVKKPGGGFVTHLATAQITYQQFSRTQLERVAEGDNPQIRSGALGVFTDSPGFTLIANYTGSYTGGFGLPMEFIYQQLES